MTLITKNQIEKLHKVHQPFCISIFVPTHRAGNQVLQKQDALALKNQWKEVTKKLKAHNLTNLEIENLLKPIKELFTDSEFWSHQSDGLAIFLTENIFEKFTLPVLFEHFNYVGNEFYLKPLMPIFTDDGTYYLLALDLEKISLYEGTRHSITAIDIEDIIPGQMEEVVGFDYEQKNLQFRSQQKGQHSSHDKEGANEERKNEIKRYFREINKGLMKILNKENKPMLIASQEFLFPIYKESQTYKNLLPEPLLVNPSYMNIYDLHELAWKKIKPIFYLEREEKKARFNELDGTEKTASLIEDVLQGAIHGKIDTLFCENRADIHGIYNPEKNKVIFYDENHTPNTSLMNLAAIKTFLNGGKVYLLEKEEMPNPYSKVNALFRY